MTKACPYGVNTERPCLANGIVRVLLKHCCPLLPYLYFARPSVINRQPLANSEQSLKTILY